MTLQGQKAAWLHMRARGRNELTQVAAASARVHRMHGIVILEHHHAGLVGKPGILCGPNRPGPQCEVQARCAAPTGLPEAAGGTVRPQGASEEAEQAPGPGVGPTQMLS